MLNDLFTLVSESPSSDDSVILLLTSLKFYDKSSAFRLKAAIGPAIAAPIDCSAPNKPPTSPSHSKVL